MSSRGTSPATCGTQKFAYGKLHGVPVYHGLASQDIWMSEQVLSLGYLF